MALSSPTRASNFPMVGLSPPGRMMPLTCSRSTGVRTCTAAAPQASMARMCSAISPCNAHTPICVLMLCGLPASRLEKFCRGELAHVQSPHWFPEPFRRLGDDLGVAVVSNGIDNGACPPRRVLRFENARPDEHPVAAQLHHQGCIGRCRDAAGGEVHHRQPAKPTGLFHQLHEHTKLLSRGGELG